MDFAELGDKIWKVLTSPFGASGFGALVSLRFVPGVSLFERLWNGFCGFLIGGFGGTALSAYLQIKSEPVTNGAAFVLGLVGMSLAAAVVSAIKDLKLGEIIASWLTRK